MSALHRLRYTHRLTSGSGELQFEQTTLSDGSDGNPPGDHLIALISPYYERVILGDKTWLRMSGGQPWSERGPTSLLMPADWGEDYAIVSGFRLGPLQELDGEVCQVITFVTAAPKKQPGWHVWWVGTESGQVRGEAMVSTLHYMLYHFMDFDSPVTISPPADFAPAANPTAPATSGP